jgi:signal peptidase I
MRLTIVTVGLCALVALLSLLLDVVRVDGNSMTPSLCDQDMVLVTGKWARRLPPPWLLERPVVARTPARDLIIKRVVATEGDRVRMEHGHVILNGRQRAEPYVCSSTVDFFETWPYDSVPGAQDAYTVPPKEIFLIGDNRSQSSDSRLRGSLAEDSIVGLVLAKLPFLGSSGHCGCVEASTHPDVLAKSGT